MNTITPTPRCTIDSGPSVSLFDSAKSWIEGEAVRQLYATAKLDGVRRAVGFPDLHPGKGSPVGAVFLTEDKIYPHLIGGDIGCGMALFKTDLVRCDAKLDRWAEKYFHLEHSWDEDVSAFLAEHKLESTEFDSSLGTIGVGNHFDELQMVEQVLDAGAFKQLGLGKQQSDFVVIVAKPVLIRMVVGHGSRDLEKIRPVMQKLFTAFRENLRGCSDHFAEDVLLNLGN